MPSIHAAIVGSDMNKQTKFETELRQFVAENKLQGLVHFVNKTLTVSPYLASIDVLVQNSQVTMLIYLLHRSLGINVLEPHYSFVYYVMHLRPLINKISYHRLSLFLFEFNEALYGYCCQTFSYNFVAKVCIQHVFFWI